MKSFDRTVTTTTPTQLHATSWPGYPVQACVQQRSWFGVVVVTVRSNDLIERLRLAGYRHVPRGAAGLRPHDLKQLPKNIYAQ